MSKEQKWGAYRDEVLKRIAILEAEGWAMAYTDGSAKQVGGWWQAGFGEGSVRNFSAPVPTVERSVSRSELRGVLRALQSRPLPTISSHPRFRVCV